MFTFLIAITALGIALYTLKKQNDCQKENKGKFCCKSKCPK